NRTNTGHTALPTHRSWPKDRVVLLAHLQSHTAPWPLPNCPSQSAPEQFQPQRRIPLSRSPANKLSRREKSRIKNLIHRHQLPVFKDSSEVRALRGGNTHLGIHWNLLKLPKELFIGGSDAFGDNQFKSFT